MQDTIVVTGAAGFIGYHVSQFYIRQGCQVVGFDNLNGYYDPILKHARVAMLNFNPHFSMIVRDINEFSETMKLLSIRPDVVIHLAAQAGVKYSIENPEAYIYSNIDGCFNVMRFCQQERVPILYASSSTVYGDCREQHEMAHVTPISLYGATKLMNEYMAWTMELNAIGIRIFTGYGPWGRPDLFIFKMIKALLEDSEIELWNEGEDVRDFTYIDGLVWIIVNLVRVLRANPEVCSVVNAGFGNPVRIIDVLHTLVDITGATARIKHHPGYEWNTPYTNAITTRMLGYIGKPLPQSSLRAGLKAFVKWYKDYYTEPMWRRK